MFQYMAQHPQHAAMFNATLAEITCEPVPAVINSYDFSQFQTIVDIGDERRIFLRRAQPTSTSTNSKPSTHGIGETLAFFIKLEWLKGSAVQADSSQPIFGAVEVVDVNRFGRSLVVGMHAFPKSQ